MSLGVPNQNNGLTSREGLYHAIGQTYEPGVVSGFNVRQNTSLGMSVLVGGESSKPDDALVFDEQTGALYPVFQNKGEQPIKVNVNSASSSQKRISSIVLYVKVGGSTDKSSTDNPNTVGIVSVDGSPTSGTPHAPSSSAIKSAIGGNIAYLVLAEVTVGSGVSRIMNSNIKNLNFASVKSSMLIDLLYPVGSYFMNDTVDPNDQFPGTSWSRIYGRFLLGANSSHSVGETGGEEAHKLTESELPKITGSLPHMAYGEHKLAGVFSFRRSGGEEFGEGAISSTVNAFHYHMEFGENQPHNNMPPYHTTKIWKRDS